MRILWLVAAVLASGCGSAELLTREQWRDQQMLTAGKYDECIAEMTKQVDEYSPGMNAGGDSGRMAAYSASFAFHLRGRCYLAVGKNHEALSDLRQARDLKSWLCQSAYSGRGSCSIAADIAELVAKTEKSAAAGSKP